MARRAFISLWLLSALVLGGMMGRVGLADTPPAQPILRIETGMHSAIINRIDTDAEGRYIVTASDDKTVRVWDAHTGDLLRVLRPPISPGDAGKIYSVALSPDGKIVACGGYTSPNDNDENIYFFDRESGKLLRRIGKLPNVVDDMAFSADGRFVAASMGDGNGVRMFRVADGSMAGQDAAYAGESYGVDFDRTGRVVTTCYDGYIRLYDPAFHLITKAKMTGTRKPFGIRFSPDGKFVAVGYRDSMQVSVLSGSNLTLVSEAAAVEGEKGSLSSAAWSPDSRHLMAGGTAKTTGGRMLIRQWEVDVTGKLGHYTDRQPGNADTLTDLRNLPDGALAWSGGEPSWGVLEPGSGQRLLHMTEAADLRDNHQEFSVAQDGSAVNFGFQSFGTIPARFNISERALQAVGRLKTRMLLSPITRPARMEAPGINVTNWDSEYEPKLNGKPLEGLAAYELARSLAIAPDASTFVVGTEWRLHCYDKSGRELWKVSAPDTAWGVDITGDGRMVVAAFGDGTIHWYRLSDGTELLTFFPHRDGKRWVIWTPQGYYDCSPGGEDLIGWHLNRDADHEADFFPASRFRDQFYRPDIIARVLATMNEAAAIKFANAARGMSGSQPPSVPDIQQKLPPVLRITSPEDGVETQATTLTVRYTVRTPSGEPVKIVRALVDGQPVGDEQTLNITAPDEVTREIQVPIPAHPCEVALVAENRYAASEPARVRIGGMRGSRLATVDPVQQRLDTNTRLLAVVIGISKYEKPNAEFGNLRYADRDASSLAKVLQAQQGVFYKSVEVKLLTNEGADKDSILDALGWLKKTAQTGDTAMIFYAGHGDSDADGNYYLLPYNYDAARNSTALFDSDLLLNVGSIRTRTVVFLDSCHSGNVTGGGADITGLINRLANPQKGAPGIVVFSAAAGSQVAQEDARWGGGHGAFTYALLEALEGQAADDKGDIWYKKLDGYLSDQVTTMTGQSQEPVSSQFGVPNFALARRVQLQLP